MLTSMVMSANAIKVVEFHKETSEYTDTGPKELGGHLPIPIAHPLFTTIKSIFYVTQKNVCFEN